MISFQKNVHQFGIEKYEFIEVLRTQPPTFNVEDLLGETKESKYYEQELLQSKMNIIAKS